MKKEQETNKHFKEDDIISRGLNNVLTYSKLTTILYITIRLQYSNTINGLSEPNSEKHTYPKATWTRNLN